MVEIWDILDKNGNVTGRVHERGTPMNKDKDHLEVYVWIENDKGEYLISQRTPNKSFPNMWECTGGNAVAGDDSLTTALKEVKEELGIILEPDETCNAMWASRDKINRMIDEGTFTTWGLYKYIDKSFEEMKWSDGLHAV